MKVVTLGEIMLRLSTPGHERFVQASSYDATFGGGEANVAVSLSGFGLDCAYVTRVPVHEIGQAAVNHLRRYGVDTAHVVRGGDRLGIYFLETGASQRSSKVIYDRSGAAVRDLRAEDVDWDRLFDGVRWFHWTGITPALGEPVRSTLAAACEAARQAGATVSCDLNYRAKLWSPEEAQEVMVPLMESVDVCIANEEDAMLSLGLPMAVGNIETGDLDEDAFGELCRLIRQRFGFETVAITLRESLSASRNVWSAMIHDGGECEEPYRSQRYDIQLVDRVGGGDAFAAGLIYGLLTLGSTREAAEFAAAASCLKQTIPGDFNHVAKDEVERLVAGNRSGRVER
jgi:2-dehydro-3-deoxygluconokinase